jgi:hypothetical protein
MLQVLHALSFIPLALAARMRRVERRTISGLVDQQATAPERSVRVEPAGRLGRFVHARLERAGVLVAAGNGRYYVRDEAYRAFRVRRRRRALAVITLLLGAVTVLYWRGAFS